MTVRSLNMRTTLTTILALSALLTAGLSAMAEPADSALPGMGQLRPEIIAPELRAGVDAAAAGEGDPVEYLVELDAQPGLEAVMFDREAVVAALKETAERSQAPVIEQLEAHGQEVLNTFWLSNVVLARSTPESMMALTAVRQVEAIRPVVQVQVPEPEPMPIEPGAVRDRPTRPASQPPGEVSVGSADDIQVAVSGSMSSGAQSMVAVRPDNARPDDVVLDTAGDGTRTWGVDRIGAHRVWDELGVDGSGVRVAVLDTGVDIAHPDLTGKLVTDDPADPTYPGGWMEWDADGNPVASEPHDGHYHGTHVSGTVVGDDNFDIPGDDRFNGVAIGVASGADLMVGAALPDGSGTEPQVLAAMQWAVDPYDAEGNPAGQPADVVNMSFGAAGEVRDSYAEAIRNMYFAGIVPVAAAGNDGDGTHGTPANVFESLAIGATDVDDNVADFSSGGTVRASDYENPPAEWPESWVVPEVSAPGVDVISAVPMGYFRGCADAGTCYGIASGTSMAAPHTAGVAALMLSGNPDVSIAEIADILVDTSFFDDRYGEQRPNTRFGHGRINGFQAVSQVVLDSGVTGRVTDADTGEAAVGVRVKVVGASVSRPIAADGGYELRLPPGSYTLEFSHLGNLAKNVTEVVVAADGLTTVDVVLAGITGQVVDADSNEPLAGVTVEIVELDSSVTTGAAGSYRFRLAPGSYALEFAQFGYVTHEAQGIAVEDEVFTTHDVNLELAPSGSIAGTVTDAVSGHGVPGVRVEVLDVPVDLSTETDGGGNYEITGVPAETYQLAATTRLAAPETVEVEVAADTTTTADIGLHIVRGVERVSVASDGLESTFGDVGLGRGARRNDMSADGRYVAFRSAAINLVDRPLRQDLFRAYVHDRETGVTELVSVNRDGQPSNENVFDPAISGDGRYVAFATAATNLVDEDLSSTCAKCFQVYLHDRETGVTELVSMNGDGDRANDDVSTSSASVSADGRYVTFATSATNLVDDDTHGRTQAYVRDRETGVTELVSVSSDGEPGGGAAPEITPNGRYVAFASTSENLVEEETNPGRDVFVRDRQAGQTEWVSVQELQDGATTPQISNDGRFVTYDGGSGIFNGFQFFPTSAWLYDRVTGQTELLSVPQGDAQPFVVASDDAMISGDGRYVAFTNIAADESAAGIPEVSGTFILDRASGQVERLVRAYHGGPPERCEESWAFCAPGMPSAISADGRFVGLATQEDQLMPGDTNDDWDVYVVDREQEPQARFAFWDLSVQPATPLPGQPVEVTVGVKNVGDATGAQHAQFRVDGVVWDMATVTLAPGESERLSWTTSREEGVSYEVRVANRVAQFRVQSGTLTGTVTDANDDLPVLNATVTAVKGESTRTSDTALEGSYQLQNLQIGTWTVTVEAHNYVTEAFEVTISEDEQRDNRGVALRTGITTPNPDAIELTVPAGSQETVELTVTNTGTADLDWNAFGWAASIPRNPSILVWNGSAILAEESDLGPYTVRALRRLGLDYTAFGFPFEPENMEPDHASDDEFHKFLAALGEGQWDLVIYQDSSSAGQGRAEAFDLLHAYVEDGGRLIAYSGRMGEEEHPWFDGDPFDPMGGLTNHPLWASLGVDVVSNTGVPECPFPDSPGTCDRRLDFPVVARDTVHWWDADHPLFAGPLSVPEFTDIVNKARPTSVGFNVSYNTGVEVEALDGAQALAGTTDVPTSDKARLVLGNDGRTLFRGVSDSANAADLNTNGIADGTELWINSIAHMLDLRVDQWLAVEDAGILAPDDSTEVTVSIDASKLAPGTYTGTVELAADAGRTPHVTVPVTVEVADACPDGFSADESIVFGDEDSGVPNYDRGHGCTFLDLVWAHAPFANHGEFVRVVRDLSEQWREEGLLTRREAQRILIAAAGSDIGQGRGASRSSSHTVV